MSNRKSLVIAMTRDFCFYKRTDATLSRLVSYSQLLGSYAVVGVSPITVCIQMAGETPAMAGDLILIPLRRGWCLTNHSLRTNGWWDTSHGGEKQYFY